MQPFPNWLVLLINVHLRSVLFFSWLHSSFLFIIESYFIDQMGHSALIHSPKKVHVGCFQIFADCEYSWCEYLRAGFSVPGLSLKIQRGVVAGLYGKSAFSLVDTTKLSSKVAAPFCNPSRLQTPGIRVLVALQPLHATMGVVHGPDFGHYLRYVVVSYHLNLQCINDLWC